MQAMETCLTQCAEGYPEYEDTSLDDDVVVQKDLTGHWEIDMNRKVNGGCRDLCRFLERGQLLKADPYLGLREANITFPTES
ncbi:unnamed protein product [Brassica napus]|uniref:Hexosyltransferase n=1 Tax=Brassica napus TaxID=3708 RepID=A0A816UKK9_BRANA|nr:unnamed protein product [Brassica napus]